MSMGKMDFESKAWAPWLEDCIKGLFDADVKCIGMVAIMEDGVAQTAYYHAGIDEKAEMKEHINSTLSEETPGLSEKYWRRQRMNRELILGVVMSMIAAGAGTAILQLYCMTW